MFCSIDQCHNRVWARRWCDKHYRRWRAHGDPEALFTGKPPAERFWEKVDLNGPVPSDPWIPLSMGCWLWVASLDRGGYGQFRVSTSPFDGPVRAHRFAYEQLVGPIPSDREIDHLCRVRHCVNPDHLEPVTHQANMIRYYARKVASNG